jgi:ankyrin repeat protein
MSEHDINKLGWEPIHIAAFNGNTDKLKAIFKETPYYNPRAKDGKTALMIAAAQACSSLININTISLLINNNTDLNLTDNTKSTALHIAAGTLSRNTRNYRLNFIVHNSATAAQSKASLDVVTLLMTAGKNLDIEVTDQNGMTPLLVACRQGNTQVIEHLLNNGANSRARDQKGRSALHLCASSICDEDAVECCKLLLFSNTGLDLDDIKWEEGLRPDEISTRQGNKFTTRMLVGTRRARGRERRTLYKKCQISISKNNLNYYYYSQMQRIDRILLISQVALKVLHY